MSTLLLIAHRLVGFEDPLLFFDWNIEQSIYCTLLSLNIFIISRIIYVFWSVLSYGIMEDKCIDDVTRNNILLLYLRKQIDPVFLWVCIVRDHRRSQNVVKHWWHTRLRLIGPFVLTTCWRHFWSIMNKRTAIWNLSVKFIYLFIFHTSMVLTQTSHSVTLTLTLLDQVEHSHKFLLGRQWLPWQKPFSKAIC